MMADVLANSCGLVLVAIQNVLIQMHICPCLGDEGPGSYTLLESTPSYSFIFLERRSHSCAWFFVPLSISVRRDMKAALEINWRDDILLAHQVATSIFVNVPEMLVGKFCTHCHRSNEWACQNMLVRGVRNALCNK